MAGGVDGGESPPLSDHVSRQVIAPFARCRLATNDDIVLIDVFDGGADGLRISDQRLDHDHVELSAIPDNARSYCDGGPTETCLQAIETISPAAGNPRIAGFELRLFWERGELGSIALLATCGGLALECLNRNECRQVTRSVGKAWPGQHWHDADACVEAGSC